MLFCPRREVRIVETRILRVGPRGRWAEIFFVARSGWVGDVVGSGLHTVGHADFYGVYSLPVKLSDGAAVPRAMGVFSTTAEGLYGYDTGARLESSGGLITVRNQEKRAVIRAGDDMLLEVVAAR